MLHDLGHLDLKPEAAGFGAVVCGHSHQPTIKKRIAFLYFNPSAGPPRFKWRVTVGELRIESRQIRGELITLKV